MTLFLRYFICFLALNSISLQGQNILLESRLIEDLSKTPIYSRLSETIDGQTQWKKEYQYLDSIEIYSISYLSDGLKINGLMVKPKAEGKYPCIIYNRGGNRNTGSLKIAHGATLLGQMASKGYVVIASQYRGSGGSEGQEEFGGADVNDVLILPRVLQEIPAADTSAIGLFGWSRGGMMTYRALSEGMKVKAAVVGGALADMPANIEDRPEMEKGVLAELVPNYEANKEAELQKRSAVSWPEKFPKDVPILLLHGNADWRVKADQSLKLALLLDQERVPYRLMIFEGGDHGISEFREEVSDEVIAWFDRFLKDGEALPNMKYHGR
ncbi:alpha/beta hydrolase family protein [Croceimicrobium hydrocarbonivorans]|uniref:Prolyl oligopeptidase family serine peptidase n=1 Tax=Croceimicrobium hydrocarbonivorans TaxID=2761580 RepID=A0A7H0VI09_9FLAO|nr:prolyl oligopeptidase family serine peptidase [Croceimicrobium hydrocarbonivorans]QNR25357.1 prolyl oligopeptidase family serine peptidase [Croceimicrobium hydrocarbonivorans]